MKGRYKMKKLYVFGIVLALVGVLIGFLTNSIIIFTSLVIGLLSLYFGFLHESEKAKKIVLIAISLAIVIWGLKMVLNQWSDDNFRIFIYILGSFLVLYVLKDYILASFKKLKSSENELIAFLRSALIPIVITGFMLKISIGYIWPGVAFFQENSVEEIAFFLLRYHLLYLFFFGFAWNRTAWLIRTQKGIFSLGLGFILIPLGIYLFIKSPLVPFDFKRYEKRGFENNLQETTQQEKEFMVKGIKIPNDYVPPENSMVLYRDVYLGEETTWTTVSKGELLLITCEGGINIKDYFKYSNLGVGSKYASVVNWDQGKLLYPKDQQEADYTVDKAPCFSPIVRLRHEKGTHFPWEPAMQENQKWLLMKAKANGFLEAGYNLPKKLFGAKDFTFNLLRGHSQLIIYRVNPEDLP